MADTRAPPSFHSPQIIQAPEVDLSLNDKAYVTDGILYRSFKTILPLDPQELSVSSRSISFYICDKVGLVNPQQYVKCYKMVTPQTNNTTIDNTTNLTHHNTKFLVACTRLYNPLCPSVGPSVRPSVGNA